MTAGRERQRDILERSSRCWAGGVREVRGRLPSCPNREVLTQEPEEVRWPVLPQAGVSPVLGSLGQRVVPHLEHTERERDAVGTWKPIT